MQPTQKAPGTLGAKPAAAQAPVGKAQNTLGSKPVASPTSAQATGKVPNTLSSHPDRPSTPTKSVTGLTPDQKFKTFATNPPVASKPVDKSAYAKPTSAP